MSDSESATDDAKTIVETLNNATSLTYLRDEGVLEGSTVVDGQYDSKPKFNHNRSASNDKHLKSHISQLQYNKNKTSLDRSINNATHILSELKDENKQRPVFYPSNDFPDKLLNSKKAHLAFVKNKGTKSIQKQFTDDSEDDDIVDLDLKILRLNVKLDNNQVLNLNKETIGHLLDEKIQQVSKHLSSLKERIDDTSSKVFITGDLNSGKSTFCNALLRRKVLPEDQQPCTTVFCEVIDSRENNGIEEVHAVPIGSTYDIRDERTFKLFGLKDLEELVSECDKYSILKVYVTDKRNPEESLLKNGVVDIALIDAPGLNMDSYQTTQVFSRQEEIDLVVFVLSAENHFTLSAKEFIAAAANEKQLIFIVVNRFDNIKDKNKCKNRILEQVKALSPDTYKDSNEFVHFISSNGIVDNLPDDNDDDNGEGSSNDLNNDDFTSPDFDHLEESLRNFVLQKRSISKLQPAKTYLTKLFTDIQSISTINQKIYSNDKDSLTEKLNELSPAYDSSLITSVKTTEKIESLIESTCKKIYDNTRDSILNTLSSIGEHPIVKYDGITHLLEYVTNTQDAITEEVLKSVKESEEFAKKLTTESIDNINKLGEESLGEDFKTEKIFREDFMFTRRRDTITRHIDDSISILDFFDPSLDRFLQIFGFDSKVTEHVLIWKNSIYSVGIYAVSKFVTTGNVVKGVYQYGSFFSFNTLRFFVVPLAIGAAAFSLTYLITDIPNALPRNLAKKIRTQIKELDYPHQNSQRISNECRKILKIPAREVQNSFQTSLDKYLIKRDQLMGEIKNADIGYAFFGKLLKKSTEQKQLVESYDLESLSVE